MSGFSPGLLVSAVISSARIFFFTFTLRPTDNRISMSTKSSVRGVVRSGYFGSKRKSSGDSSSTRWKRSVSGTPEATSAACAAASTADLNSPDLPLRNVTVTSGMESPPINFRPARAG